MQTEQLVRILETSHGQETNEEENVWKFIALMKGDTLGY